MGFVSNFLGYQRKELTEMKKSPLGPTLGGAIGGTVKSAAQSTVKTSFQAFDRMTTGGEKIVTGNKIGKKSDFRYLKSPEQVKNEMNQQKTDLTKLNNQLNIRYNDIVANI